MRTVLYHLRNYLLPPRDPPLPPERPLLPPRDLPPLEERPLLRDLPPLDPPLMLRDLPLLRELPLEGTSLKPRPLRLDELERLLMDEPVEPRILLELPESDLRLRFLKACLICVLDLWTLADLRLPPELDLKPLLAFVWPCVHLFKRCRLFP